MADRLHDLVERGLAAVRRSFVCGHVTARSLDTGKLVVTKVFTVYFRAIGVCGPTTTSYLRAAHGARQLCGGARQGRWRLTKSLPEFTRYILAYDARRRLSNE